MTQKNLVIIVIALCISLGVGFLANRTLQSGVISDQAAQIKKLHSQIEQAKNFFPPLSEDVRSIFGTVKEARGDTVMVEITLMNPFDESPQTRTVKITDETKIVRSERKDPVAYQREIAEFQKNIEAQPDKSPGARLTPPNEFSQEPAKISDIAVGQQISIAADENIRDKESFTAKTIIILPTSTSGAIPQSGAAPAGTP